MGVDARRCCESHAASPTLRRMGRYRVEVTIEVPDESAFRAWAIGQQAHIHASLPFASMTESQQADAAANTMSLPVSMVLLNLVSQGVGNEVGMRQPQLPFRLLDVDGEAWVQVVDLDTPDAPRLPAPRPAD